MLPAVMERAVGTVGVTMFFAVTGLLLGLAGQWLLRALLARAEQRYNEVEGVVVKKTTTPKQDVEEAKVSELVPLAPPEARSTVVLTLNGKVYRLENVSPRTTLLWWLRDTMNLTGAKIGCGEGGCGACTVIEDGKHAINSCLRLLVACDGKTIETVEYQGSSRTTYSPEQLALADGNGTQCGYCTPGWVQAMRGLRLQNPSLTAKDIEEKLDGNICRCTGTMPIVKAFKEQFVMDLEDVADKPCQSTETGEACGRACDAAAKECCKNNEKKASSSKLSYAPDDADEMAILGGGHELVVSDSERGVTYVAPTSLEELYHHFDTTPCSYLIGGSTAAIGVSKYYCDALQPWMGGLPPTKDATLVATKTVPELTKIVATDTDLTVGSAVTISDLLTALEPYALERTHPKIHAAVRHLKRVANTQVRNSGTWAGNLLLLANAPKFISDLLIGMTVADASLCVSVKDGFLGRKTATFSSPVELVAALRAKKLDLKTCVVLSATIPLMDSSSSTSPVVYVDKVAARHANAHAIVNCGLTMYVKPFTHEITSVTAYFGGLMAPDCFENTKLEQAVYGKSLNDPATLQCAVAATRCSAYDPYSYEADLATAFVYKWFAKAMLEKDLNPVGDLQLANSVQSLAVDRPVTQSSNNLLGASDVLRAPANTPRPKLTARLQASGEATYCSDLPLANNEVYCHFAFIQTGAGTLTSICTRSAMRVPGVVCVLTAQDLIEHYGHVATLGDPDDLLLYNVNDPVFVGARVAIAVADTYEAAIEAARCVSYCVDYSATPLRGGEYVDPTQAIALHYAERQDKKAPSSVSGKWRRIGLPKRGLEVVGNRDVVLKFQPPKDEEEAKEEESKEKAQMALAARRMSAVSKAQWGSSELSAEEKKEEAEQKIAELELDLLAVYGVVCNDTQKHFTLETHSCRSLPVEDGVIEVWSSSQNNSLAQTVIALGLNKPESKVCIKVKRIGGGFGSKLSLHLAVATSTSIVADLLQRPARTHAERRDDQHMTGGRESCHSRYVITADRKTNKLLTYFVDFEMTSGVASGDGMGDLGMAVAWSDNCYKANLLHYATGRTMKTPAPRNTSMRSPGVLQSHATHEVAMVHLAHALGKPVHEVQECNFYDYGDMTPYGYTLGENGFNWTIPQLWAKQKPKYVLKLQEVEAFNKVSKFKKRGVHMSPTKFVMSLSDWKIPAFVVIFSDGSVEVTTGGCEIGQGLYVKVAQTAAHVLGCDISYIKVGDTTTDKNPNATGTGGSGTSESACNAAILACRQLRFKLEPYLLKHAGVWADAVAEATMDTVDLRAVALNDVKDDPDQMFDYATYGVGITEMEVDVLTGEVSVRDVDVCMDQGTSLNAEIDLGQLEGGFVIALGFYFTEKNDVAPDGSQTADGTWEYKPPIVADLPLKMHTSFLPLSPNPSPVAVLNSKASGEPPMQLVSSAFLAAHAAIREARKEFAGNDDWFDLPIPATPMDIRKACLLTDANLTI